MNDLAELFDTDPLKLTKPKRMAIIDYYRSIRHTFKSTGKAPSKSKAPKIDIELDL